MVSFALELNWTPEKLERLSAELESLLQERNDLIHLDLAQRNFEDEANCNKLINKLDTQNDRIGKVMETFEALFRKLQSAAEFMNSDEVGDFLSESLRRDSKSN